MIFHVELQHFHHGTQLGSCLWELHQFLTLLANGKKLQQIRKEAERIWEADLLSQRWKHVDQECIDAQAD